MAAGDHLACGKRPSENASACTHFSGKFIHLRVQDHMIGDGPVVIELDYYEPPGQGQENFPFIRVFMFFASSI